MNVFDPNSITLQLQHWWHRSRRSFLHQIPDFSGQSKQNFWSQSIHSWLPLSANCGVCRECMTLMSFDHGLAYHLPDPVSVWFTHTGAVIGRGGADPWGDLGWKECKPNAAGSELSQHQRHKHTMSGWIEGCKDSGRRDVVYLVIWSQWRELWIK